MSQSKLKILMISSFDGRNANVIRDYLFSFRLYSSHQYYYIFSKEVLHGEFDFSAFDVILIFWSTFILDPVFAGEVGERIRMAPAVKILFLQDEYRLVRQINQAMQNLGIQILFTCISENDAELFYPRSLIPSLENIYTVLTGYVPHYLKDITTKFDWDRPVDIGYRSRIMPFYLGDLGQEKGIIAERFQMISTQFGFRSDISVKEDDRLYGQSWIDFLMSCKFILGTPSGASVIDFYGNIGHQCGRYLLEHPSAPYEKVKELFFVDVDGKVIIDTISPRSFEATALGCILVMHEGEYGGIVQPDIHYISIKKDYSNLPQVIERMRDASFCKQIWQNAYHDLILNDKYSYRTFISWFDQILDQHISGSNLRIQTSPYNFYIRNYLTSGQQIIPGSKSFYMLPAPQRLFSRIMYYGSAYLWISRHNDKLKSLLLDCLQVRDFRTRKFLQKMTEESILMTLLLEGANPINSSHRAFGVNLKYNPLDHRLIFTSSPNKERLESDSVVQEMEDHSHQGLRNDLLTGRVRELIWDHWAISSYIDIQIWKNQTMSILLGLNGIYQFEALVKVFEQWPDRAVELLQNQCETK